jgi:Trk-type K+ transport system membrane component
MNDILLLLLVLCGLGVVQVILLFVIAFDLGRVYRRAARIQDQMDDANANLYAIAQALAPPSGDPQ